MFTAAPRVPAVAEGMPPMESGGCDHQHRVRGSLSLAPVNGHASFAAEIENRRSRGRGRGGMAEIADNDLILSYLSASPLSSSDPPCLRPRHRYRYRHITVSSSTSSTPSLGLLRIPSISSPVLPLNIFSAPATLCRCSNAGLCTRVCGW
ncbi:hypothetical protein OH76DRAFT_1232373 [Lentinus brumalis]|uniref:Uncharacterized protein n=1 Tax=Lentinus brumalis TaxID=2498619 RepID=A0A371CSG0_9APHY|nr:hypothetical protein OH76DRAFT_1232373 [Polyporus brumalis]